MAQDVEHHVKFLIGDLVVKLAMVTAENDALREQLPVKKRSARPEQAPLPDAEKQPLKKTKG